MDKKYRLTDETIQHRGITLYRIEALRDFNDVNKGDKGGFIESENNLSQDDNCWIYNNAKVFGNASVFDNARVYDNAEVYGSVLLYGIAIVVSDNVIIKCNSKIHGKVKVAGNAYITDAEISKKEDYIVFKNWWSSRRYFT